MFMSWDIFLQTHENGGVGYFPLSVFLDAFGDAVSSYNIEDDKCSVLLEYKNQDTEKYNILPISSTEIYIDIVFFDNVPMLSGFSVNRPPAHDEFWQGLCNILKITSSALFWGGEGDCLAVGREETITHLPEIMIDSLGSPTIVSDHQDIFRMLES